MLLPICASKYVPVFHKENMTDDDIVSESVYKGMPVFSVFFFFFKKFDLSNERAWYYIFYFSSSLPLRPKILLSRENDRKKK